eukprot:TRINITY_DN30718_c0_g1_i1.p1 TRINITY_DN30718_c0_g1~~TRINITY_DN30718_c0_g1_i1.p1  ORF type:complete len:329 (+),score=64.36 TRINITY_DN30718_c0_g1_i1:67-987(+)
MGRASVEAARCGSCGASCCAEAVLRLAASAALHPRPRPPPPAAEPAREAAAPAQREAAAAAGRAAKERRLAAQRGGRAKPGSSAPAVRVLCLHAFGSSADEFRKRTAQLRRQLRDVAPEDCWVYLDGPRQVDDGRAWWTYPGRAGERQRSLAEQFAEGSFLQAAQYLGVDDFLQLVKDADARQGPFQLAVGFSQGGVAVAGAHAAGALPSLRGAVFMSAFPPRDPTLHPPGGAAGGPLPLPTLHVCSAADNCVPAELSRHLMDWYRDPRLLEHDRGHVAGLDADGRKAIGDFLRSCVAPAVPAGRQ